MAKTVEGFIPVVSVVVDVFYPYSYDLNYPSDYFERAETLEQMIAAWEVVAEENAGEMREFDQVGIYDLAKGKVVKVFKFGLTEVD